jgi:integrase
MGKNISREYPEGRPGYGEVKPRIIERKDGTTYQVYIGCYKGPEGNRKFPSHENKKELQRLLRVAMNEVEAGTYAKDGNITLQAAIDEYLNDLYRRQSRGEITRGHCIKTEAKLRSKRLSGAFLKRKLSEFKDSGLIREEINRLRDNGMGLRTAHMTKNAISYVFDFCVTSPRGYIPRNVLRDDPIRLPTPQKRMNAITEDDFALLLAACLDRNGIRSHRTRINFYAAICLMHDTGARPEEVCGLKWEDIVRFDTPHPEVNTWWGTVTYRRRHTQHDGFLTGLKEGVEARVAAIGRRTLDALNLVELYWAAIGQGKNTYQQYGMLHRYMATGEPCKHRSNAGIVLLWKYDTPYTSNTLGIIMQNMCDEAELWATDSDGRIIIGANGKKKNKYSLYSIRKLVTNDNVRKLPSTVAASITGHTTKTLLEYYTQGMPDDLLMSARVTGEREQRTGLMLQQKCDKDSEVGGK